MKPDISTLHKPDILILQRQPQRLSVRRAAGWFRLLAATCFARTSCEISLDLTEDSFMPGSTVLDDIELIIEDIRGTGGGKPPSRDGDDDGGEGGGNSGGERNPEPRRSGPKKYSAAIALAMLSNLMFFMVLDA